MKYEDWRRKKTKLMGKFVVAFLIVFVLLLVIFDSSGVALATGILLGCLFYLYYQKKIKDAPVFYEIERNGMKARSWFDNLDDEQRIEIHNKNKKEY